MGPGDKLSCSSCVEWTAVADQAESIPLEPESPARSTEGGADQRPRMPEPLPVRLVAVEDVTLPASAEMRDELDAIYIDLLEFERVEGELAYRADNFTLRFKLMPQPVAHDSLRAQGIEVLSLAELEKKLIEAEIEYTRQRSLTPGLQSLLFLDPAGNWLEISERRIVP